MLKDAISLNSLSTETRVIYVGFLAATSFRIRLKYFLVLCNGTFIVLK